MKENRIKRFFETKISLTGIVFFILAIITIINILKFCLFDLYKVQVGQIEFYTAIYNNVVQLTAIWLSSIIFIVIALIIDSSQFQSRGFSLSKIDFINEKNICREILQKYSAMSLAYLDNFKEDTFKYSVITLLMLERKGKINIKETGIEIVNTTTRGLKESEKYVFSRIKNGLFVLDNPKEFKAFAKSEGLKDKLLEKSPRIGKRIRSSSTKDLIKYGVKKAIRTLVKVLIAVAIISVFLYLIGKIDKGPYQSIFSVLFGMIPVFVAIFLLVNYISYENNLNKLAFRTELGDQINTKLEGLKNYIKGYSLLSEKDKEQLILWDEFLIYSVMFNQNKKVLYDVSRFIIFK